jgi:hypothetical protein
MRRFATIAAVLALALGATGSQAFARANAQSAVAVSSGTLFPATSGIFYSAALSAVGGTGPYAFSVVAGSLPNGLSLAADGTISGIADAAPGVYGLTVQALDASGGSGSMTLKFFLATPVILVTSVALPAARVGAMYGHTLYASGGSPGYIFSLAEGSLPDGVQLASNGVFSGLPKSVGVSLFTVQIVDARGIRGVQTFRFGVQKAKPAPKKTRLGPR